MEKPFIEKGSPTRKLMEENKISFEQKKKITKKFLEFFSNHNRESFWFLRPAV